MKEFKMPKSIGLKFISTLRDNNYIQSIGGLTAGKNAVCALGVLAKVLGISLDGNSYTKIRDLYGQPFVLKMFQLNDADKLSLKQIGDWIEKNVELY